MALSIVVVAEWGIVQRASGCTCALGMQSQVAGGAAKIFCSRFRGAMLGGFSPMLNQVRVLVKRAARSVECISMTLSVKLHHLAL